METIEDVKKFWNTHPITTFEFTCSPFSKEFFDRHDAIKRNDIERFGFDFWEFDKHKGAKVLDIGCGAGWLVRQFASGGAHVTGVDLTPKSLEIVKAGLDHYGLKANLVEASAEALPFPDGSFDYLTSSGVLHHTPNTKVAFEEAYRVLKPGAHASISLYYKNVLLKPWIFPLTRTVFSLLSPKVPGRRGLESAKTPEEFVRIYDGDENPIGKVYSLAEAIEVAKPFEYQFHEIHYFPARFLVKYPVPRAIHKLLDSSFGTMIYLKLRKPLK